MVIIYYLIGGIELIIFFYLAMVCLHNIVFSVSGLFYKKHVYREVSKYYNKILLLVPGYKEDAVICSVAEKLLNQNYPADKYDIMIIADSFMPSTLQKLKQLPVFVKEVKFDNSTKIKSLKCALSDIPNGYDIGVILDADNVLEVNFLHKINSRFIEGNVVIQGKRVAKNNNTSFAILDGLSESINNHIHRKGPVALGYSSSLIGSGMAFDFKLLKELVDMNNAVGGFDRELQLTVVDRGIKIEYLDDAIIYDEKVDNPVAFSHQRRRWLSSQFYYLRKYFVSGFKKLLIKGDINYFRFAVVNNILLPNVLYLPIILLMSLTSYLLKDYFIIDYIFWTIIAIFSLLAFYIPVYKRLFDYRLLLAFTSLPLVVIMMTKSLLKIKGANKSFIHTPHSHVEVKE